MPEKKRVHVPTKGRENTTLIITNPDLAQRVQRDINRTNTPDQGGVRIKPQKKNR